MIEGNAKDVQFTVKYADKPEPEEPVTIQVPADEPEGVPRLPFKPGKPIEYVQVELLDVKDTNDKLFNVKVKLHVCLLKRGKWLHVSILSTEPLITCQGNDMIMQPQLLSPLFYSNNYYYIHNCHHNNHSGPGNHHHHWRQQHNTWHSNIHYYSHFCNNCSTNDNRHNNNNSTNNNIRCCSDHRHYSANISWHNNTNTNNRRSSDHKHCKHYWHNNHSAYCSDNQRNDNNHNNK